MSGASGESTLPGSQKHLGRPNAQCQRTLLICILWASAGLRVGGCTERNSWCVSRIKQGIWVQISSRFSTVAEIDLCSALYVYLWTVPFAEAASLRSTCDFHSGLQQLHSARIPLVAVDSPPQVGCEPHKTFNSLCMCLTVDYHAWRTMWRGSRCTLS